MPNLQFTLVRDEDGDSNITVYNVGGSTPYIAHETHPAWDEIIAGVLADDPDVIDLFDIAKAIGQRQALGERVSYGHGRLFFDGDPVDDALSRHIVRTVQADEDYSPLVALFENIALNPSESSREQMYRFLDGNDFTITHDGMIVGYKGVTRKRGVDDKDEAYRSINAGTAFVNGQVQNGQIEQRIGDVIEMPRADVVEDSSAACSVGLHVATFRFAHGFGSAVLEVHVHPRDVVSVPDGGAEKVRVCRYRIIGERTEPYDIPVLPAPELVVPVVQTVPDEEERGEEDDRFWAYAAEGERGFGRDDGSSEDDEPEPEYKHPSNRAFNRMKAQAKMRKKGFIKYASRKWTLIEGDGSQPEHWAV